MVQKTVASGLVIYDKETGFTLKQNKLVNGHYCLNAVIDFKLLNYANASASATLRIEDTNGNLLTTSKGKATETRSLNIKDNNNAKFSINFDIPTQSFLTQSRAGKKLKAKFTLRINEKDVMIVYQEFIAKYASSTSAQASKQKTTTTTKKKSTSTPNKKTTSTSNKKTTSTSKVSTSPKSNNHLHNPDNDQWEEECALCGGTGRCNTCHGVGQYFIQSVSTMWPCGSCYSTGKCRMCQGRGKNVYRVYKVNGVRYMQRNSETPTVIGEGDTGRRCGACSGLGRCAVCQGSGRTVSYNAGEYPTCTACGGSGRCAKCGGSGCK